MAVRADASGDRCGIDSAPTGDYTVMFWTRATSLANAYDVPFWMGDRDADAATMYNRGMGIFWGAAGDQIEAWLLETDSGSGPTFFWNNVGGGAFSTNTWYHLCLVGNTGANQAHVAYTDGVQVASGNSVNSATYQAERVEVCNDPNLDNYVAGRVAWLKVWNRQLTVQEINAEMRVGLPVSADSLWGCWTLTDDSGGLIDLSGNGRNLTEGGTLTVEASDSGTRFDDVTFGGWHRAAGGAPAARVPRLLLLGVGS